MTKRINSGFTLIELMIVIAIIGILAAVAVPQYSEYTKKAKFTNVIAMARSVKMSVEDCIQHLNAPEGCNGGNNGVLENYNSTTGLVESITTTNGTITAVGSSETDNATYILDSSYNSVTNSLTWTLGGSCITRRYC